MPVVAHDEPVDNSISVLDLKDGQIAQITRWGSYFNYVGWYVQRSGVRIFTIGSANSWWDCDNSYDSDNLRVKVLPDGYLLKVVGNEKR